MIGVGWVANVAALTTGNAVSVGKAGAKTVTAVGNRRQFARLRDVGLNKIMPCHRFVVARRIERSMLNPTICNDGNARKDADNDNDNQQFDNRKTISIIFH